MSSAVLLVSLKVLVTSSPASFTFLRCARTNKNIPAAAARGAATAAIVEPATTTAPVASVSPIVNKLIIPVAPDIDAPIVEIAPPKAAIPLPTTPNGPPS